MQQLQNDIRKTGFRIRNRRNQCHKPLHAVVEFFERGVVDRCLPKMFEDASFQKVLFELKDLFQVERFVAQLFGIAVNVERQSNKITQDCCNIN